MPTPPGTGVIDDALPKTSSKSTKSRMDSQKSRKEFQKHGGNNKKHVKQVVTIANK